MMSTICAERNGGRIYVAARNSLLHSLKERWAESRIIGWTIYCYDASTVFIDSKGASVKVSRDGTVETYVRRGKSAKFKPDRDAVFDFVVSKLQEIQANANHRPRT